MKRRATSMTSLLSTTVGAIVYRRAAGLIGGSTSSGGFGTLGEPLSALTAMSAAVTHNVGRRHALKKYKGSIVHPVCSGVGRW